MNIIDCSGNHLYYDHLCLAPTMLFVRVGEMCRCTVASSMCVHTDASITRT